MGRASGGTGFQITAPSGKQYTLTNYHVCMLANKGKDGNDYMTAEDYNGSKFNLKVLKYSSDHDLCLLEPMGHLPTLKTAFKYYLHEQVYLIGHPRLANLTMESGSLVSKRNINIMLPTKVEHNCKTQFGTFINNFINRISPLQTKSGLKRCMENLTVLHINVISYGGNSGSPVVDDLGNVVGVLFAGSRQAVTATFAVPLEYVKSFIADK